MAIYNCLYFKRDYPRESGYRWEAEATPSWLKLEIIKKPSGSKQLVVHSKIHVNKRVEMSPVYSDKFTDIEIIKDQSANVYNRFIK